MGASSSRSLKAIKRKPVVTDVANQLRAAILEGELLPGSKIVQDDLANELGVSRLPVRQALIVLQREGLVFLDHGRGAVVAPLDIKFISDVFDWRAVVDSHVAGVLATRKSFDPARLQQIVALGTEAAQRGESRRDLVMEFHTAQYDAVGNQVLVKTMKPLLDHVQRVVRFVQSGSDPARRDGRAGAIVRGSSAQGLRSQIETWQEHAAIAEAIGGRRVGRARTLARDHVDHVKRVVVSFLVANLPAPSTGGKRGTRETIALAIPDLAIFDLTRPE